MLVREFVDRWWLISLRGALAIVLGLVLITHPAKSLVVITWLMGLWALIEGVIVMLMSLIKHKEVDGWGLLFLQGLVGLGLGLVLMSVPVLSLAVLTFLVGLWLLIVGIILLVQAIQVRKEIMGGEWMLIGSAIVSVIFGMVLMGNIAVSVAVAGFIFGVILLITGIMTTAFGFQLKRETKKIEKALR